MIRSRALQVVILAPGCDGQDVGESWSSFQWVAGLSSRCRVTLLTLARGSSAQLADALPNVEIVQWPDWPQAHRFERFASMAKPGYLRYYRQARRWIRGALAEGRHFDLIHQLGPLAMRYPCPASRLGVPVIIGPLAGSLETPAAFRQECGRAPWYTRLRSLDRWRVAHDPWLRSSYASADVVIGVAPYVAELLRPIALRRFELAAETGIHDVVPAAVRKPCRPGHLRLLYAGRVIRTKGLRDLVRAMGQLRDLPAVTLDVAGDGEDLQACRLEASALGVADRIRFRGRVPRAELELLYSQADVFAFPSFREPSGNVVFEAMRHGLPVIACDRGGPAHVVDASSGFRLAVENPAQLARDLASTIRQLGRNPERVLVLSQAARHRVRTIALWDNKIERMFELYRSVTGGSFAFRS